MVLLSLLAGGSYRLVGVILLPIWSFPWHLGAKVWQAWSQTSLGASAKWRPEQEVLTVWNLLNVCLFKNSVGDSSRAQVRSKYGSPLDTVRRSWSHAKGKETIYPTLGHHRFIPKGISDAWVLVWLILTQGDRDGCDDIFTETGTQRCFSQRNFLTMILYTDSLIRTKPLTYRSFDTKITLAQELLLH